MAVLRKPLFLVDTPHVNSAPSPMHTVVRQVRSVSWAPKLDTFESLQSSPAVLSQPANHNRAPEIDLQNDTFEPLDGNLPGNTQSEPAFVQTSPSVINGAPSRNNDALAKALCALQDHFEQTTIQAAQDALEIGMLVAKRILEKELATSPETLRSLVESALYKAGEERVLRIHLHPDDASVLTQQFPELLSNKHFKISPDDSLLPGDVVVETKHSRIDGRLNTRLHEIEKELQHATQHRS